MQCQRKVAKVAGAWGLVVTFGGDKVVGIVVVHHHFAHVPVHPLLVLEHGLIEDQITAGEVLEFEQDVVVF